MTILAEPPAQHWRMDRRQSKLELEACREGKRSRCLTSIRETSLRFADELKFDQDLLFSLFNSRDFSEDLFDLFDVDSNGYLTQNTWMSHLKEACMNNDWRNRRDKIEDLVNLLDAVAFLVCMNSNITQDQFYEIISTKGISNKWFECIGNSCEIYIEDLMAFVVLLTKQKSSIQIAEENFIYLESVFKSNLKEGQNEFTLSEFKNILQSQNTLFLERVFKIFDKDGSGTVSLEEFMEMMQQFATKDDDFKINFLFQVYDPNGDGVIDQDELSEVLRACMLESGIQFAEEEVNNLAQVLYQDSVREGMNGITVDDLKEQFQRHEGLLENLSLSIEKLLSPPKPTTKSVGEKITAVMPYFLSVQFIINNRSLVLFSTLIIIINIILFTMRGIYFLEFPMLSGFKPNLFYVISRACGRVLLFNSTLLLIFVLRYTMTTLRNMGLAACLPLDHNIAFHKKLGMVIFILSWIHTIMHLLNFGINIQPDPILFVQLSAKYWAENGKDWTTVGYNLPTGCQLLLIEETNITECIFSAYHELITHCQVCNITGKPWSYIDWIFTYNPGVFGLIGGWANPTGVALILLLSLITVCSLSVVRRSGHFQVFYFTHLLNIFYWVLLILHCPDFWKWIFFPAFVYCLEIVYRLITSFIGHGKTKIIASKTFPSKVTNLMIKRPHGFKFNPGDWVFIKIPEIALFEWHPFTISSAPEVEDSFSVHIRGVGEWTNKVWDFFQPEQQKFYKQNIGRQMSRKIRKSFKRKESEPKSSDFQEIVKNLSSPVVQYRRRGSTMSSMETDVYEQENVTQMKRKIHVYVDGPFGSPSSNIYRAEHAVLIGTGIGITPFASILQSIMKRHRLIKKFCPNCDYAWTEDMKQVMFNLRKVDFFWINRDQISFEWFVKLLAEMELEQAESGGQIGRFLDMHMYITSALQRTDMKAVILQLAMELHHKKAKIK